MKTIANITIDSVREAFRLSRQGGTHRATLYLITEGETIPCHVVYTINDPAAGEIIRLFDAYQNEYVVDPAADVIQYDDGQA